MLSQSILGTALVDQFSITGAWRTWVNSLVQQFNAGAAYLTSGSGSPEGVVTRSPGYVYMDVTGKLYVKQSGTDNIGWVELV